jgi:ureidoacrylate peracid hydrolase
MLTVGDRATYSGLAEVVEPRRTAVLVIDQQKDFTDPDGYYSEVLKRDVSALQTITTSINALTAAARHYDVPVIFTRFVIAPHFASDSKLWLCTHAAAGLKRLDQRFYTIEGTRGADLADGIVVEMTDLVISKYRASAFHGTSLDALLRARNIETLVIAGQVGEGCVESTVRHARDLDYWTVLVPDAIGTLQPALYEPMLNNWKKRAHCPTVNELIDIWTAKAPS